jgi:hypothetical protein
MKRTTIFVPEPLERDLQLYARLQGKPVAFVVREALAEYLAARRPAAPLPSFVGVGDSGRTDIAEHHEELLWTAPRHSRLSPVARRAAVSKTRRRPSKRR